jgi:hypothetical protein
MHHILVGTFAYGRVKKVGSTPIVTRFFMVSGIPVFPLESWYFIRIVATISDGVPFIAQNRSMEIEGIPLARLDKLSIAIAYARAVFTAMAVGGAVALALLYIFGKGDITERETEIGTVFGTIAAIGTVAASCTYILPFQMTRRERNIRRLCGPVLKIAADPARVRRDYVSLMERVLDRSAVVSGLTEMVHELARTRMRIALGEPRLALENHTDTLLERITTYEKQSA